MESKNLAFLGVSVLLLVFLVSFASALTIADQPITLTNSAKTRTVTITSTPVLTPAELFTITSTTDFQPQTDSSGKVRFTLALPNGGVEGISSAVFTITATQLSGVKFLDSYSTTFSLRATNTTNAVDDFTITANYENTEFCSEESSNNLDITIDSISTKSGFGNDEDFWYPLDEVEIDVSIDYNGDNNKDKFQDGTLDWAIYTSDGEKVMDGDESISNLKDGNDEIITLSIKLDPNDLDVATEDYVLYVSATGKENYDSSATTDKKICFSDSQDIEIRTSTDDNFVVLDNIKYTPDPASCDSEVMVTADVWNIGADDQSDVVVRVFIEDGITFNQEVEIGDINSFDKENLELKFNIPDNAQDKTYHIRLWVYDEDNDVFQNEEDDLAKYDLPLIVSGEGCTVTPEVVVLASLVSGGKAGQDLVVKATITNSGDSLGTFNLALSGYNSFAESAELDQETLAIGAGQSKEVMITLAVNKDASGEKTFTLDVSSAGESLARQPVTITITPKAPGWITGGVIGINSDNWYLWGIGALNVILVIIIIIVAVRIARS